MDVLVLSSARKLLSRSILGSSLAGDGLLVRLRSTSIGLLGLVAAVGLGLVAFISQLGWPGVFSQPIPGSPSEAGTVHDAIALTRPAPAIGASSATHALMRAAVRRAAQGRGGRAPNGSPAIGGSRQLAGTGGKKTAPASPPAPAPAPAAEPKPLPSAPASEATSQPTTTTAGSPGPTASSTPKTSSQTSGSTSNPKSDAKATTKRHSAAKSKAHGAGSTSAGLARPESSSPGKSGEDHGGRPQKAPEPPPAPSKPSAPPAAAPPPKAPPAAPEYGEAKDEGGPGKSDWRRH